MQVHHTTKVSRAQRQDAAAFDPSPLPIEVGPIEVGPIEAGPIETGPIETGNAPHECSGHVEDRENPMNEFLNPKSMLTPGAAGSMVMLITNALCLSFAIGKPQWLALLLSFLFGAFVLSSTGLKKTLKLGFWFVNSLIIFSVSVGTAKFAAESAENATAATTVPAASEPSAAVPAVGGPDLLGLLIPAAVAQQAPAPRTDQTAEQQRQLLDRLLRENQALKQQLRSRQAADLPATAPPPATAAPRPEAPRPV
jgi:hypothetical protein